MMRKSKCKWCVDGTVFDERTGRQIGNCFCYIDAYDNEVGCNEDCHYYQREKEGEEKAK